MSKIIGVTHIIFCKYPTCKSAFAYEQIGDKFIVNYESGFTNEFNSMHHCPKTVHKFLEHRFAYRVSKEDKPNYKIFKYEYKE